MELGELILIIMIRQELMCKISMHSIPCVDLSSTFSLLAMFEIFLPNGCMLLKLDGNKLNSLIIGNCFYFENVFHYVYPINELIMLKMTFKAKNLNSTANVNIKIKG